MALLSRHVLCALFVYLAVSPCVIDATGLTTKARFRTKFSAATDISLQSKSQLTAETETQGMTDMVVLLLEVAYAAYNYNLFSKHEAIVSERHNIQTGYHNIYQLREEVGKTPEDVKTYFERQEMNPSEVKRQLIEAIAAFSKLEVECNKDKSALSSELQDFQKQLRGAFKHAQEVVELLDDLEARRTCDVEDEPETQTEVEPEPECELHMVPDEATPSADIVPAAPTKDKTENFFFSLAKSSASTAWGIISGFNWRRVGQSAASIVGVFSNPDWRRVHWNALKTSMKTNYLALKNAAASLPKAAEITSTVSTWIKDLRAASKFRQSVMLTTLMAKVMANLPRLTIFLKDGVKWLNNDPMVTTMFAVSSVYNLFNMLMVIFLESPFAVPVHTYLALLPWMVNIMVVVTDDSCTGRLSAMHAAHKRVYHNKDFAEVVPDDLESEVPEEEDDEEEDHPEKQDEEEEEDEPDLAAVVKEVQQDASGSTSLRQRIAKPSSEPTTGTGGVKIDDEEEQDEEEEPRVSLWTALGAWLGPHELEDD